MTLIDHKAIHDDIKKTYEELPEPPEFVPIDAIIDKIKEKVHQVRATDPERKFIFDSLPGQ